MSKCTCTAGYTTYSGLTIERCDWCKQNQAIADKAREYYQLQVGEDHRSSTFYDKESELWQLIRDSLPAEEVG
jgi:hypothetical protein